MDRFINWAGHGNLGDDAMDKILRNRFPDTQDWTIIGGGTLIINNGEFLERIDRPEKTIGISLGVGYTWKGEGKDILQKMHKIYVRDYFSHYKLLEYGVDNTLSVDLLCYLEPVGRAGEGIKFANLLYTETEFDKYQRTITQQIDITGYEQFALSQFNDLAAMPNAPVYSNAQKLLNVLSGADEIIATRLHANVLAWITGSRVIPICYCKKVVHFYQRVAGLTPREARDIITKHLDEIEWILKKT